MKIFWSWQNDYAPKRNRWFIQKALEAAVVQLADEYDVEPAERPELDHDTQNEAGMVEITTAILEKINRCAAFVADLTPIARTSAGKAVPNPNVAIELGWALKMPGWRRMIAILNTADGFTAEDLPFDIRHRRALSYSLAEGASKDQQAAEMKRLTSALVAALKSNLDDHMEQKAAEIIPTGVEAKPDNPSIWKTAGPTIPFSDSLGRHGRSEFAIPDGPRAYARFIPGNWKRGIPRIAEIEALPDELRVQPPLAGVREGDWGPTEEGLVRGWYTGPGDQEPREAGNLAMYFDETGEFWTTSSTFIHMRGEQMTLGVHGLINGWRQGMRAANATFDRLGAITTRTVELGIVGLSDVHWPDEFVSTSPPARKRAFRYTTTARDWSEANQLEILENALNMLRDVFGLPAGPAGQIARITSQ